MTLEELENLADVDLKINDTELDIESLKIPQLHNKYSKFHNQFINLLKKSEQNRDILIREKWEYYTGKASPTVYQAQPFNLKILRQDVDKYIKSDIEVVKIEQKIAYLQSIVNYLERTIRIISNRTFQIKNAIEWRKFTSGIV
ncbi:MAG TPA: hypothetical protein DCS22_09730 [Flavobacteriaceae bacterium]|nr:hypothetical protein [Flavobacteriaceae bacterium]|tara:strand:- start:33 stop:461 length:429 start_codon:yes stop_codon:yes gene_type:complete